MNQPTVSILLDQIVNDIKLTNQLSKDNMRALYHMAGSLLIEALYLIDHKAVTQYTSESGRSFYKVTDMPIISHERDKDKEMSDEDRDREQQLSDEDTSAYTCFINPRYCNCQAFLRDVICCGKMIMCRHVLASLLSDCMGVSEIQEMEDMELAKCLYMSKNLE
ncbi:hypothetical protein J3Q64DRAFT_1702769 [Phycomyces blakesleeanus]|uniref:SWIM-type domain-containing protein n=2 Tax=Phycomyces blakesleeanus TaxID=4837 RepID=A0A167N5L3_PHYB8|nr:hypothetical protein PHYBLDRAFT_144408 [Phycomyces blakesleeanus NRRL 1555(-)]OAD75054.1 hypothetical protein PHYBLDRAFT_144408 [Phycomyces blakesleeanus NRRL 1555(-)]|eukprot:XP_018293094.1 hypothetical protein PHYBLDRAFT_144408 [Phycomyces blakesleeanus NRRL 1555(-)]